MDGFPCCVLLSTEKSAHLGLECEMTPVSTSDKEPAVRGGADWFIDSYTDHTIRAMRDMDTRLSRPLVTRDRLQRLATWHLLPGLTSCTFSAAWPLHLLLVSIHCFDRSSASSVACPLRSLVHYGRSSTPVARPPTLTVPCPRPRPVAPCLPGSPFCAYLLDVTASIWSDPSRLSLES